jgi:hypothetical protein
MATRGDSIGSISLQILSVLLAGCLSPATAEGFVECVDFESLTAGAIYYVSDTFNDGGATIQAEPFQWGNLTWTSGGEADVVTSGLAGGSGNELLVNNINLRFSHSDWGGGMFFRFGEYGGNLNIEINGVFLNFSNFDDIDGMVFNGVLVAVVNGFGNDMGTVRLIGAVNDFMVGGQELWIDDLCTGLPCIEFEDLPYPSTYIVGDSFVSSGIPATLQPFQWGGGTWTSGGEAQVSTSGIAGGSGQDMMPGNISIVFNFPATVSGLTLLYGDLGGNINLRINGDHRNTMQFADLDGMLVGGVLVDDIPDGTGGGNGQLYLEGYINNFRIGGQELWIDTICYETIIFADDFETGDTRYWSVVVP